MIVFRRMKQHVSLVPTVFDKLTGFLLTWNGQSLDQQEKHHEPVTSTATELFSSVAEPRWGHRGLWPPLASVNF